MTRVIQVVDENLPGDAIGNDALAIQAHLSAAGITNRLVELFPQKDLAGRYSSNIDTIPKGDRDSILVLHTREPHRLLEQFASWLGPVVVREHGAWLTAGRYEAEPALKEEWIRNEVLLRPLYGRSDLVLATSEASANRARRLGAHNDVQIAPPLFPDDQFAALRRDTEDSDPNVLVVGRLDAHAGIAASLNAFHILASTLLPDAQLTIIGRSNPSWLYSAINETIGSRRLRARMLGHVSQSVLLDEYAKADAMLILSESSGFAVRAAEAQLTGIPVVGRVGKTSLEVPSGEHDALRATVANSGFVFDHHETETVIALGLHHAITSNVAVDRSAATVRFSSSTNAKLVVSALQKFR